VWNFGRPTRIPSEAKSSLRNNRTLVGNKHGPGISITSVPGERIWSSSLTVITIRGIRCANQTCSPGSRCMCECHAAHFRVFKRMRFSGGSTDSRCHGWNSGVARSEVRRLAELIEAGSGEQDPDERAALGVASQFECASVGWHGKLTTIKSCHVVRELHRSEARR
jgi:hypothetical protein